MYCYEPFFSKYYLYSTLKRLQYWEAQNLFNLNSSLVDNNILFDSNLFFTLQIFFILFSTYKFMNLCLIIVLWEAIWAFVSKIFIYDEKYILRSLKGTAIPITYLEMTIKDWVVTPEKKNSIFKFSKSVDCFIHVMYAHNNDPILLSIYRT